MPRIGFLGAGQMATALAKGFVEAKLVRPEDIIACDVYPVARQAFTQNMPGAKVVESNAEVVQHADLAFIAVKPQNVATVLSEVKGVAAGKLFVSIAAGLTLSTLCAGLGTNRVIRVMPNTPCLIGTGASAYSRGTEATAEDAKLVGGLLRATGVAIEVEERLLDAVTGLSGSGPAFVYVMIEAMADGGVRMGLPRATALELAAQTVLGAAQMVKGGEHPAVLKDRVASPGGTTIAGLQVMEERAVRGALIAAIEAATRRSQELGKG